jgi:DNA replication and repair protein RecF
MQDPAVELNQAEGLNCPHDPHAALSLSALTPETGIVRLVLTCFRSYPFLSLQCDLRPVVLTGANGAGKTNILEAISFLSPGRGLRNIRLSEASYRHSENDLKESGHLSSSQQEPFSSVSLPSWAIAATYTTIGQGYHLGTGLQLIDGKEKRVVQVDGTPLKGQTQLTDYLNIVWLTPQMDRLFCEGASTRRRFFDRLVYGFDPSHATRLNRYEYYMRERNRLLQQSPHQSHDEESWLSALEHKMAEEAIAIAAARLWVLEQLRQAEEWMVGIFPAPVFRLEGTVENLLTTDKAVEAEAIFAKHLYTRRSQDREAGRALEGVHRTDLHVIHREKGIRAEYCSTGEQKALLVAILMAAARLQARLKGKPPILLLDEVAAHLDTQRRHALFTEILGLRMQAWMTGTEAEIFAPFGNYAQHFQIKNGNIQSL